MEHYLFVALFTIPLLIILIANKKNIKNYIYFGLFAVCLAFVFENVTTYLGFWNYFSYPMIPYASFWTVFLYFHYAIFCYYCGNLVSKK